ncbi:MAG: outer membrane lipoprotein carrier protein LolA [Pseudomonadota bacterium]
MLKALFYFFIFCYSTCCAAKENKSQDIMVPMAQEKYHGDTEHLTIEKKFKNELEELDNYMNSFSSMSAHFRQSNVRGEISYGVLYISKPGKIRCEYTSPSPILLIMNNNKVTYYDKELDEVSYASTDINALRFLAQDNVKFAKLKIREYERDKHFLNIKFEEYSSELKQNIIISVKFSYPGAQLKQIAVLTEDNEVYIILDKIAYNKHFGKELFYFNKDLLRNRR